MLKQVGGVLTAPYGSTIPCHNGMVVRSVIRDSSTIIVYLDNVLYVVFQDTAITGGQPGLGLYYTPAGNSISSVSLGALDQVAPPSGSAQTIATSPFPNRVDFQWQGMADDANGIGVAFYEFFRNSVWVTNVTRPEFSDGAVAASTTYSD